MLKISARSAVSPFIVMDVMQAAAEQEALGKNVLHLEVGQPSTSAPKKVLELAKDALVKSKLGYTVALGIPELRESISQHYKKIYNLDVSSENIAITTGSSGGFVLGFLAAFDKGDRIALARPGYPCYRNILKALDLIPIDIDVGAETGFQITAAHLKKLSTSVQGIIIAGPGNPTGTLMSEQVMKELADYCKLNGIRIVSDEIYHGITFENAAKPILSFTDEAIVVNSFSKYFSMTGWRIGWLIAPKNLIRVIERLEQNLYIAAPTISQFAAIGAFEAYEELDQHVKRYKQNRDILLNELPSAKIADFAPCNGAFYLYADVAHLTNDSKSFCKKILEDTSVAITPGIDFDPVNGHKTIRFSYAGSTQTIVSATKRISNWIKLKT